MPHPTWRTPDDFSPEVVLKLRDTVAPPRFGLPIDDQLVASGVDLSTLRQRFGALATSPAFRPRGEEEGSPLSIRSQMRRFVSFRLPKGAALQQAHALAEEVRAGSAMAVERTYVTPAPAPPPGDPASNPSYEAQTYLQGGGVGIDAVSMWDYVSGVAKGATGVGVTIADIEEGWDPDPDLPAFPVDGDNYQEWKHGRQVMGVMLASNNAQDCIGVAHGAQAIGVSLHRPDGRGGYEYDRRGAIDQAVLLLEKTKGGILVLEVQVYTDRWELMPAEYDEAVTLAIQDAVRRGIVVVEAAGNEGISLDEVGNRDGVSALVGGKNDSGAILVAAGTNATGRWERYGSTNWGSRVNCFAPADRVVTLPVENPSTFGSTSAATAIVAGAAALIQSWAIANLGAPLDPSKVREMLSDDSNVASGSKDDEIGVMPDLATIRARVLEPLII